eukprot:TRINITY_DN23032_c0_g1_i1.p1 TRINITY_DN23032_c0_g1~~TRINITY_DN23032_c0_g1_i1.p1  ORF type:complete len:367 (+),score=153.52 TRINITY_DN23032_c0_g1_i1:102-1202(+)
MAPSGGVVAAKATTTVMGAFIKGLAAVLQKNAHLYVLLVGLFMMIHRKLRSAGILEGTVEKKVSGRTIRLTDMEHQACQSIVDAKNLTETLDEVGGLEAAKRTVRESVIKPLACPKLYPKGSLRAPPKGVLLYGPPGTGKTLLARTIAKEANATFMEVRLDRVLTKWVGESEKHVAAIFSLARKLEPTIIFIDEIDGLLSDRDTSSSSPTFNLIKTVFMTEWDGLTSAGDTVLVVGATNRPGSIDDAILRRMPVKLKVDYPTCDERADILRIILAKDASIAAATIDDLNLSAVARECVGYSGSDLHELCKEACLQALQRAPKDNADTLLLATEDFRRAQVNVKGNQGFVKSHSLRALLNEDTHRFR